MNQPASDWPQAPAADPNAALAAPTGPVMPGPPAPMPAPAAPGEPVAVQLPTAPGAMLDAGVPLQHAAAPAMPAAPAGAMPAAPANAMPAAAAGAMPAAPANAMPTVEFELPAPPQPDAADASDAWWSPGNGLLLAVAALAWQFVSFYAREQLPVVETSGEPLTRFDQIVGALPVAGSSLGALPGLVLAAGALAILLVGVRRGLRDVFLQGLVGVLALVALLLTAALPQLA